MATTTQMNTGVSQLYVALFGRAPDAQGLDFWAGLLSSGQTLAQVADTMFGTAPARAYFPNFLTNQEIISSFYFNVLGRQADAGGLAFWTAKLDAAGATPGLVIAEMIGVIANYAGADPAGLTSAALFNNRSAAAQFYAEHNGSLDHSARVLLGVTADASTIAAARTLTVASGASGTVDAAGFTEVSVGALSGDLVVSHVAAGTGLTVTASTSAIVMTPGGDFAPTHSITWQLADASGAGDALAVTLKSANTVNLGNLRLPGIENLTVHSTDTDATAHYDSIYLADEFLKSIVVTGNVQTEFGLDTSVTTFDGSALAAGNYISSIGYSGGTVTGGAGDDTLMGWYDNFTIVAGGGNDFLLAMWGTLTGGAGADEFKMVDSDSRTQYITITDFSKAEGDTIAIGWAAMGRTPAWTATKLSLAAGASFDNYLNAATAGTSTTAAPTRWFQYGGDTWIVIDNSTATTFQDGSDVIVKLVGTLDLSTLALDSGYWALH